MNKNRFIKYLLLGSLLVSTVFVWGSEMEILVLKLKEKGILTETEAQSLIQDAQNEYDAEIRNQIRESIKDDLKDVVPGWVRNGKMSGDLRLRYQFDDHNNSRIDRHRGRIRFRLGMETTLTEQLSVGFRLATGSSSDQTSANQTFTNSFSSKSIWLDRAYARFKLNDNWSFTGGKMKNPFYHTSLLWDGDVSPEGLAAQAVYDLGEKTRFFMNAGYFTLREDSSSKNDPYLAAIQAGITSEVFDRKVKVAAALYEYQDLEDQDVTRVSPACSTYTNTLYDANGDGIANELRYEYRILDLNAQAELFTCKIREQEMPFVAFGNYLTNLSHGVQDDYGWLAGFKFGKAKKAGDWQLGYNYRFVGQDCVPSFMNDSDFHGGGTNGKGHQFKCSYKAHKNTMLSLSLFDTKEAHGSHVKQQTAQLDIAIKF